MKVSNNGAPSTRFFSRFSRRFTRVSQSSESLNSVESETPSVSTFSRRSWLRTASRLRSRVHLGRANASLQRLSTFDSFELNNQASASIDFAPLSHLAKLATKAVTQKTAQLIKSIQSTTSQVKEQLKACELEIVKINQGLEVALSSGSSQLSADQMASFDRQKNLEKKKTILNNLIACSVLANKKLEGVSLHDIREKIPTLETDILQLEIQLTNLEIENEETADKLIDFERAIIEGVGFVVLGLDEEIEKLQESQKDNIEQRQAISMQIRLAKLLKQVLEIERSSLLESELDQCLALVPQKLRSEVQAQMNAEQSTACQQASTRSLAKRIKFAFDPSETLTPLPEESEEEDWI